jgi:hypothetical protein
VVWRESAVFNTEGLSDEAGGVVSPAGGVVVGEAWIVDIDMSGKKKRNS